MDRTPTPTIIKFGASTITLGVTDVSKRSAAKRADLYVKRKTSPKLQLKRESVERDRNSRGYVQRFNVQYRKK